MNDTQAEHRQRAAALGLRQTSAGSCPRRLAGIRCTGPDCWCASRLNDHGRRYRRDRDNRPVVMWEPYDAWPEELAEVFAAASVDRLRVKITGASPWNPGLTLALMFTTDEGAGR